MSKERLENINKRAKHKVLGNIEGEIKYRLTEINTEDYEWLIEQAERAQELKETVERYQSGRNVAVITKMKMDELEQQNKRYREALEFYADENNYREQELKGIVPPRPITFKPILHDYGSIARQALEGKSDA